jgi:hypothetical protein
VVMPNNIRWRSLSWGYSSVCGLTLDTNQLQCFGAAAALLPWQQYSYVNDWITWQMASTSGCGLRSNGTLICIGYAQPFYYQNQYPVTQWTFDASNSPVTNRTFARLWVTSYIACGALLNEDRLFCWGM